MRKVCGAVSIKQTEPTGEQAYTLSHKHFACEGGVRRSLKREYKLTRTIDVLSHTQNTFMLQLFKTRNPRVGSELK